MDKLLHTSNPSSSRKRLFMERDVIKISPNSVSPTKPKSFNNKVLDHEVINVDSDEDPADLLVPNKVVDSKNRGKAVLKDSGRYDLIEGTIILDSDDDDDYVEFVTNGLLEVDEYSSAQSHFDNVDIPPGVEAPVTQFWNSTNSTEKAVKRGKHATSVNQLLPSVFVPGSSKHINVSRKSNQVVSGSLPVLTSVQHMRRYWTHHSRDGLTSSSRSKMEDKIGSGEYANGGSFAHTVVTLGAGAGPSHTISNQSSQVPTSHSFLPASSSNPSPVKHSLRSKLISFFVPTSHSSSHDSLQAHHILPREDAADSPKPVNEEVLKKFKEFKHFDTVEDHSDHHYKGHSNKQPSKTWTKSIQKEWKILESNLPDAIFVRAYESRMELMRAVIVGAEGTPYHDGLFFFDFFFPSNYPNAPPSVYYHSGGVRINPNLYQSGKVCLSLLGTWTGNKNERWRPGESTLLQVLVSIQALVLNVNPYFNEPGYEKWSGSSQGEMSSLQYNENTFNLSLKTMVYSMRKPPKNFEDFVLGHFHTRAREILVACQAYVDGARVGSIVKGGVQDVAKSKKGSSNKFRESLPKFVDMVVKEFQRIGVENIENITKPSLKVEPTNVPGNSHPVLSCLFSRTKG